MCVFGSRCVTWASIPQYGDMGGGGSWILPRLLCNQEYINQYRWHTTCIVLCSVLICCVHIYHDISCQMKANFWRLSHILAGFVIAVFLCSGGFCCVSRTIALLCVPDVKGSSVSILVFIWLHEIDTFYRIILPVAHWICGIARGSQRFRPASLVS